ncbi:MAG: hypothetical protein AAGD25_26820 [Cyanobacteria bacterium P01_F01_bin.150]
MQADNSTLWELHQQLRTIASTNTTASASIQRQISNLLPESDIGIPTTQTGGQAESQPIEQPKLLSHPHKKTPKGETTALHMNYTRNRSGEKVDCELDHLRFFAQTAQTLGIHLEILVHTPHRQDVDAVVNPEVFPSLDYSIIESSQPITKWAEDSVEYLANGNVAVLTPLHDDLLEWAMKEGRRQRWNAYVEPERLEAMLEDDHLWVPLGIRVNSSETGQERERVAQAMELSVSHIRTYIEGGNMITGEDRSGQTVVLVGKDAIATTACFYQLTHDDVRQVIAEDFGLDSAQIIAIEQPGQFHLDMGLLFIGDGTVILNDSQVGLENAKEMAELAPCTTTESMAEKMQLQCALETAAAQDLENAGFTVIRKSLENSGMYNFFNGEFVTGSDGHTHYITNGGPLDQQDAFFDLMVNQWRVVKTVFFSPSKAAYKSLQDKGGVGCRLKGSALDFNKQ